MADQTIPGKQKKLRRTGVVRRAALLETAADIFLQEGYEGASVSEINARAGGSKAFIYEQFGDKAGLFRAVMMERCESVLTSIGANVTAADPPVEVLTQLGRRFLQAILSEDNLSLVRVVYKEGLRHTDIADIFFSKYEAGIEQLAGYLATVAPGVDRPLLDRLALTFFFMVRGDAFDRKLAGCGRQRDDGELEEQVAFAVEWLLGRLGLPNETG